jgi:putative nucleotidyltransferase with HDIG domain
MRRQEARRQRGETRGTLWQNISRAADSRTLLIWAGFSVAAVAILLAGRDSMPWRLDQRVDRDIVARIPFSIEVAIETDKNRQAASAAVPQIYEANDGPLTALQERLTEAPRIEAAAFSQTASYKGWNVQDLEALHQYVESQDGLARYDELVKRLIDRLEGEYLVDRKSDSSTHQPAVRSEMRRPDQKPLEVPTSNLIVTSQEAVAKLAAQSAEAVFPPALRNLVAEEVKSALTTIKAGTPSRLALWHFDAEKTAEARREAREKVPPVIRSFKAGDILIAASYVRRLSMSELDLLKQEHRAFLNAQRIDPFLRQKRLLFQGGIAGIVLLVTIGLAAYTALYESSNFQRPGRTIGLAALLLVMLAMARLIELAEWPLDLPVQFSVGLLTIAAALMTIAFSQRFAFGGIGALSILVTLASRGNFSLFITLLTAMGITIFLLREIRTRSKIIMVGTLAGVGAMLTFASAEFVDGEDVRYVLVHMAVAGLAALVAGFIVQGILPQFERIFGIATSMTLLEWCDASRPLLRLLAQNAPGTYSHSLIISQMAEEAAEAIGARGLLARVGALYHDVGKAAKPDYFVENQEARINRHDKLSPTMSLLIIVGHVKDGIEMARAYGLPKVLHQFIAEHHGTTVIRCFHRAAIEAEASGRAKRFCDRDVPESEFRYPGPKPSSRESAILMLCDGCESAVRALPEPSPGRIETAVHQVIMDRLNDGQFDECDITLRELKLVERSLVKSLCAIHHGRIKYPEKTPAGAVRNGNGNGSSSGEPRRPAVTAEGEQPPVQGAERERTAEVVR